MSGDSEWCGGHLCVCGGGWGGGGGGGEAKFKAGFLSQRDGEYAN